MLNMSCNFLFFLVSFCFSVRVIEWKWFVFRRVSIQKKQSESWGVLWLG